MQERLVLLDLIVLLVQLCQSPAHEELILQELAFPYLPNVLNALLVSIVIKKE